MSVTYGNHTTNSEDRYTEYTYEADQQTGKQIFAGLNSSGTLLSETTYDYNLQGRMAHVEIDSDGDGMSTRRSITSTTTAASVPSR